MECRALPLPRERERERERESERSKKRRDLCVTCHARSSETRAWGWIGERFPSKLFPPFRTPYSRLAQGIERRSPRERKNRNKGRRSWHFWGNFQGQKSTNSPPKLAQKKCHQKQKKTGQSFSKMKLPGPHARNYPARRCSGSPPLCGVPGPGAPCLCAPDQCSALGLSGVSQQASPR